MKLPKDGWIHLCKECERPTAKELYVFVLSNCLNDNHKIFYCQSCFRHKIIVGKTIKNYKIRSKTKISSLFNAVVILMTSLD